MAPLPTETELSRDRDRSMVVTEYLISAFALAAAVLLNFLR